MKQLTVLVLLFCANNMLAQKWSIELSPSMYRCHAYSETVYSGSPAVDLNFEARSAFGLHLYLNYKLRKNVSLVTGIGAASYRYFPDSNLTFGSQNNGQGGFRDIGFDENGLVENYYLGIPIGIEYMSQLGRFKTYQKFHFNFNYSLRDSPLISLEQESNKLFVTGVVSFGVVLLESKNLSFIMSPFVEYKPYNFDNDHSYSDEKLAFAGLMFAVRFQNQNNINIDN